VYAVTVKAGDHSGRQRVSYIIDIYANAPKKSPAAAGLLYK
jgi:hypothetical protein